MKVHFLLVLFILVGCASKTKKEPFPNIVFEVTEGILHPESALYSPKHQAFFVSNVASGNPLEKKPVGYLSKISKDGKVIKSKWVTGLRAPKGIAIVGNNLYVSDIDRVIRVNISKAKISEVYTVKDGKFLNDVVADAAGNVYISDMFSDTIYRIQKNKLSVWVKDPKVAGSNGLYTDGKEHLIAVKWGTDVNMKTFVAKVPGDVAVIPLKNPSDISVVKNLQGHLDGIDVDNTGTLWISDWISGDIYTMSKKGEVKKMFNLGQGTADLSVARELGLLVIPQMLKSKLIFIKI